jgi:hypothetical protein
LFTFLETDFNRPALRVLYYDGGILSAVFSVLVIDLTDKQEGSLTESRPKGK